MDRITHIWIIVSFVVTFPFTSTRAVDSRVATQVVTLQVAGSALLGIGGPPVVLKMAGAIEAGDSITQAAENSDSRLKITSLVKGEERRVITAKISESLIGTQLLVDLQPPNFNFSRREQMGTLKGQQLLTYDSESTLVEGIGTCWSGKNDGDGYVIKYTYKAIPGASILKGGNIVITYTISLVPSDSLTE
jgi:hypothetical protein